MPRILYRFGSRPTNFAERYLKAPKQISSLPCTVFIRFCTPLVGSESMASLHLIQFFGNRVVATEGCGAGRDACMQSIIIPSLCFFSPNKLRQMFLKSPHRKNGSTTFGKGAQLATVKCDGFADGATSTLISSHLQSAGHENTFSGEKHRLGK